MEGAVKSADSESARREDLKYLENHFEGYKKKALESGPWRIDRWPDYLKAHGILNACVARDEGEHRQRQIYDLEADWYRGEHPLTYNEFQVLSAKHKRLLEIFRKKTNADIDNIKIKPENLNVEEMFSEYNRTLALELCEDVFAMSKKCSDNFVKFSEVIMKSSVDVLSRSKLEAPCPFAVIGLGSVARGVATPFSDLEYAFIVDSHSYEEYFTKLAIDTYFRIGNLSESPMKTFNANSVDKDLKYKAVVGYRIDGISDMAGNIPTGNPGGQSLTLTVDELVKLYKTSAMSPLDKNRPGGFSDLISASVLIYSNDGGRILHRDLAKKLSEESKAVGDGIQTIQKRLETIDIDVKYFKFLPKFQSFGPPENTNVQVKSDIFRFPTLITTHLGLLLTSESCYPWDVLCELQPSSMNYMYMKIVLGFSILIRNSAYLALGSQSDHLSLYTSSSEVKGGTVYHVPRNIFVFLGCLLIPIRLSIQRFLKVALSNFPSTTPDITYITEHFLGDINIKKGDVKLQVEVFYFAGDFDSSLCSLYSTLGEKLVNTMPEKMLKLINGGCSETTEGMFSEIVCFLLLSARKYRFAKHYLKWLAAAEPKNLRWKILFADCLNKLHQFKEAVDMLNSVVLEIIQELNVSSVDSLPEYLLREFEIEQNLSDKLSVLENAAQAYRFIADSYCGLKLIVEAELTLKMANSISEYLISKFNKPDSKLLSALLTASVGSSHFVRSEYVKAKKYYEMSLEKLRALHGVETNQPDIAGLYRSMGRVYKELNHYGESIKWYGRSHKMLKAIHCNNTFHRDIAECLVEIGSLYIDMAVFKTALNYIDEAFRIFDRNQDRIGVVDCYVKKANACSKMKEHAASHKHLKRAIEIVQEEVSTSGTKPISELATIYKSIGLVYQESGDLKDSMFYHGLALEMVEALYLNINPDLANNLNLYPESGEFTAKLRSASKESNLDRFHRTAEPAHPDIANGFLNIGCVNLQMGDYGTALDYLEKALNMQEKIYGANTFHVNIAACCANIGLVYNKMGKHVKSLEYHTKSLHMRKAIYGGNDHVDLAASYNHIGIVHYTRSNYHEALDCYTKSLDIMKAVYGINTANAIIAAVLNNIGNVCLQTGDYPKSLKYLKMSLEMTKILFGKNTSNPEIAECHDNIGNACFKLGKYDEALENHLLALDMRKAIYGEKTPHPDLAMSYTNTGSVYGKIGQFFESLTYHEKALATLKGVHDWNTSHPDVASSLNNIGIMHQHMRKYSTALECHRESLKMNKSLYGDHAVHCDIARSYHNMGMVHLCLFEYREALDNFTKSLKIELIVYGEDAVHDSLATTYSNMGSAYGGMGKHDLSLKYKIKALKMTLDVFIHAPHCNVIHIYNDIGNVYETTGKYNEALEFYIKALDMEEVIDRGNSVTSNIAKSYDLIGAVYLKMGKYLKSLEYFEKSLDLENAKCSEHVSISSSDMARSYSNIGDVYEVVGNYPKALEFYIKSLNMWTDLYGENASHYEVAITYNCIGHVYMKMEEYGKALDNLNKALVLVESGNGEHADNPDLGAGNYPIGNLYRGAGAYLNPAEYVQSSIMMMPKHTKSAVSSTSYYNIGKVYKMMREFSKSLEYHIKSLKIRKALYHDSIAQSDIANSYNDIGNVYDLRGEYSYALQYHTKALGMRKDIYGDAAHSDVAASYNNIGNAYRSFGNYYRALEYYNMSIEMKKSLYGKDATHSAIATTYENIGGVYKELGKFIDALEYFNMTLNIMRSLYGESSANSAFAKLYLIIADTLYKLEDYTESLKYYIECLIFLPKSYEQ